MAEAAVPGIDGQAGAGEGASAEARTSAAADARDQPGAVVGRLRHTFDSGRTRPAAWRRAQLEGMKRMLVEREDEFLDALAADLGKPRTEGWLTDVVFVTREIDHTLKHLADWMRPERVPVPAVQLPGRA